jgi:hypothetical protein
MLPLFLAKKEVFEWLRAGNKTIDVRKGKPQHGETAVFLSGSRSLRLKIIETESGNLRNIVREDNYRWVIPTAENLDGAIAYLCQIYGGDDGVFTAYHLESEK